VLIWVVLLLSLFSQTLLAAPLELTEEESRWLAQHQTIRIGIAEVPPQQAFVNDQGELEGLAIEYLDAIEEKLGVSFERALADSYGEMIRQARQRQVDIVYAASRTDEREQFLDFTRPYSYLSNHIFVRAGDESLKTLSDFDGLSFAVTAGTAVAEYVKTNYPAVKLIPVKSSKEAFSLLTAGQVVGVGATAASAHVHAYKAGLHNIMLVGPLGFDYAVSMAARNDWPLLVGIIQKSIDSLSPDQIEAIKGRWSQPMDMARSDLARIKENMALLLTAGALLMIGALFWWNRSLKWEIGNRKQAEQRLSFLAYHDETTGLLNRAGFMKALEQYHADGRPYALLLLGLDQFRVKNELWGQDIGNEILRQTAQRLQTSIVQQARMSRIGGDEFAVLFESDLIPDETTARKILSEIRRPMMLSDHSLQVVSATAGVVEVDTTSGRAGSTLQRAEVALKYAKRQQRGDVLWYDASMGQSDTQDQIWKEQLVLAIDNNQLFLEYQPQLDLQSHEVVGFEALVRWQHPEKGRVPPCDFIPLAERTGLISALGDWVLKTACQQACDWRKQGVAFEYIAVNVSVRQFVDADFARKVMLVLTETGLPPHCLELEITETLFMNEFESVRSTLEQLSRQGVRFSIDDFGTGFSSLLYLKQLPVETLKLAQEFVLDIAQDSSSLEIVSAATQLGHSLGMRVIAEGVEDAVAQGVLQTLDCDLVQGYYYSRPVAAEMITQQWLTELSGQMRSNEKEDTAV